MPNLSKLAQDQVQGLTVGSHVLVKPANRALDSFCRGVKQFQ
jgi:hypothetical protein